MPIDVVGGIAAARHGAELLKTLRTALTDPEIDHAEVINRLIEIQGLILDAQSALVDAQAEKQAWQTEKQGLQSEIAALKRVAEIGKNFKSAHGVYWHEKQPYCPVCWDVDRKPVRLGGPIREKIGRDPQWTCPLHKSVFTLHYNAASNLPE